MRIDFIFGLFDCHRSTYLIHTGLSWAIGEPYFPSPASSVSQLDNRIFYSVVLHKILRMSGVELNQNESTVCSLVHLTVPAPERIEGTPTALR
jgi:hypothetical protein